ncbi:MAG: hypothetical protein ACREBV_07405, partial [Candidatus Zixiibacteriota bacterium]
QELIDKYLKKKTKQTKEKIKKLYWVSGHYSINRINRDNDYNKFAIYESSLLTNTDLNWLNTGSEFGLEFGWLAGKSMSWTIAGEYWMPLGETQSGSFNYNPPSGSTTVTELNSEIKVYGVSTGLQYYIMNPPTATARLTKPAVKLGIGAGYYSVKWELWDQYENLNLATSTANPTNSTFRDNTFGFTFNVGGEYPISASGLAVGLDLHYLYLNFKNVAWYNSSDQEVVATYEGNSSSRVNLGLSGIRAKLELKKFFNW